jgi:hypothetical protein
MNDEQLSPRLQEFQQEVDDMKVSGGRANPEKTAMTLSIILFAVAVGIEIYAFSTSRNTTNPLEQNDMQILAMLGIVLALGAVALFVRMSFARWFRYWLVRMIYENRDSTDKLIEALGDKK